MRVMGEMKERYGRDENDLSHAEIPLYKGNPSDYGRDERIYASLVKLSPKQQDDIMKILAHFGSTEGIHFDHYETDWDFG